MISKKTLEKIANLSKVPLQTFLDAIAKETEVEIEIDDTIVTFLPDELTQRDTNNKTVGKKEGEAIGEEKGKDLATKAIKNKLGITEASKDPEEIATLIQKSIAGDTALKDQISLLTSDLSTKDKEINTLKGQLDFVKVDSELLTLLPTKRTAALETAEHLDIVKKNLEFTAEGVKWKGDVLRDEKTHAALDKKSAIEHFYNQRTGLLDSEDSGGGARGRGAGDSGGGTGKYKTLAEVRKAWEANNAGKNWGSMSSQDHLQGVLKENPDLVMEDDGN